MQIKNRVKDCKTVHYTQIEIIQGDLKELSKENYEKLRNEIRRLGITAPNFVWKHDKKLKCIDGTQRLRTYAQMEVEGDKIPKIPIIEIDADNEKEAREMLLGYISQYGKITSQGLAEYLRESDLKFQEVSDRYSLPDTDLQAIHDEFYKDALDKKAAIEDDVPEIPKDPVSKLGDIYELGEHRLMCGDSTSIDAIEKLMNGENADMVFTDPPYGMNLDTEYASTMAKGGKKRLIPTKYEKSYDSVIGDNADFTPQLISIIFDSFPGAKEIFLWGADYYSELLVNRNDGSWVIWDKRCDESADKMFGSVFETCWSKSRHKREIARIKNGLFGVKDDSKTRVHPTQKPIQLAEWFFERWGKECITVADLYGGSGSTLIACEKTNRKCFMMEIDPHYIDVIITRWCKYTGKNTIKRNGKPITWSINGDDPKPNTTLRKKTKGQPIAEKTV